MDALRHLPLELVPARPLLAAPHAVSRVNVVPHLKVLKVTSSEMPNGLLLIRVKVLVNDLVGLLEDGRRWTSVVVILPVELCLPQAEVKTLLLKVCIGFLAFVGTFHHLLGIAQSSLPCRLKG